MTDSPRTLPAVAAALVAGAVAATILLLVWLQAVPYRFGGVDTAAWWALAGGLGALAGRVWLPLRGGRGHRAVAWVTLALGLLVVLALLACAARMDPSIAGLWLSVAGAVLVALGASVGFAADRRA